MIKILRPQQTEALEAIENNNRGIINLPTGTGKTLIQSRAIANDVKKAVKRCGVYVILSPRILLSNQILEEVQRDLTLNSVDAHYHVVHSGKDDYDRNTLALLRSLGKDAVTYRQIKSGTSSKDIIEQYNSARKDKVPLIISSTYHSFGRVIASKIPITVIHCDEAHYLVTDSFEWISALDNLRAYFYTATTRETPSKEDGIGMNNEERFGKIIAQKTPLEMIEAGEMVRPRLHLVDMQDQPQDDSGDALAIVEAFKEHKSLCNVGAKLLVVAKGQEHIQNLMNSKVFAQLRRTRPNLKMFDITSEYGARVNGIKVSRDIFFKELRNMTDSDDAIIVHYDILTEGIDVPGITGVMLFNSMKKSKFLQTNGRASRLHSIDRARLYSGEITPSQLDEMVKKYSYVIVPVYGSLGDDLKANVRDIITELRSYGFKPSEDIVIKQKRGKQLPVSFELTTSPTKAAKDFFDFATTVIHDLEDEEKADLLAEQLNEVATIDQLAELLV